MTLARTVALGVLAIVQLIILMLGISVVTHIGRTKEWKAAFRGYRTDPTPEAKAVMEAEREKGRPREYYATAVFGALFIANGLLMAKIVRGRPSELTEE